MDACEQSDCKDNILHMGRWQNLANKKIPKKARGDLKALNTPVALVELPAIRGKGVLQNIV